MGNEVVVYQELERKALAVAKSGLFGVKTPEQAIALFLIAEAENIPIMQAVLDYHIIDNKPALKSDAMLRRFQASGGIVKWVERTDEKVSAFFSHPSCPDPVLIDWDISRAAKAGLSTKVYKSGEPNMWTKYPRQMLTARVISEGIRATAPGSASGIYTPEEVVDFTEKPVVVPEQKEPVPHQDAEIVPEVKPLSDKTKAKFEMAKGLLNGEFDDILHWFDFKSVDDIKSEDMAKTVLRKMRIAYESKQPAEVAK